MDERNEILPFLKWAGGKRWFVRHRDTFIPEFKGRYIEPFLGGGAVFFSLKPKKAIISDANPELIDAYIAVRDEPVKLEAELRRHHELHCKDYYYYIRSIRPETLVDRAARFIYLNRTCWNGLYRVNLKGEFNVPIGTKQNVIYEDESFLDISRTLKKAKIYSSDFEETIRLAKEGDFVFVDPPYTVKHNHNGFIKYNESIFSWADQERLKVCVDSAVSRGALVLVTNANHDSICELYSEYNKSPLQRASVISGSSKYRGVYSELIIKCW